MGGIAGHSDGIIVFIQSHLLNLLSTIDDGFLRETEEKRELS